MSEVQAGREAAGGRGRMRQVALWLTIATLIAAAVIGAVFIIVGDQADVAGRVWLTLLLLAGFAGAVVLDGVLPEGPNHRWYLITSTLLNVFLILIGLVKIWNGPLQPGNTAAGFVWHLQFWRWVGLLVVVRIALLITQFWAFQFISRAKRRATRVTAAVTVVFVWLTALVFVLPLSFPNLAPLGISGYADWWWRIAGATTLVMAVTVIIPLVIRAFEPRAPRAASPYGPPPRRGEGPQPPYGWQPYGEAAQSGQPPVYGQPFGAPGRGAHPPAAPGEQQPQRSDPPQ